MDTLESLKCWSERTPENPAFIDHTQEISYFQLQSLVMRFANYLDDRGVRPGMIANADLPSFVGWATILALEALGATSLTRSEVAASKPILIPDWHISQVPDRAIPEARNIIVDHSELEKLVNYDPLREFPGFPNPMDIVRLFMTSGTTGDIKFVPLRKGTLPAYISRKSYWDEIGSKRRLLLNPLGAKQIYGYGLKSISLGAPMFFCNNFDFTLPSMIRKYEIDSISGSGLQISKLLELIVQTGTQLPNLKNVILSGSEPNLKTVEKIRQVIECKIFNAYGSTEAGNVTLSEIGVHSSIGAEIANDVTLEIVNENDLPLPQEEIGIIRYKSPAMVDSYYQNLEDSKKFFKDGFFYPGDLGRLTEAGRLILEGRQLEVLNIGGVKYNPDQIDNIAMSQLGIIDCASFEYLNERGEDSVGLAIVISGDYDRVQFSKTLAVKSPIAPSLIVERKFIPRNENGKILRRQIQEDLIKFEDLG